MSFAFSHYSSLKAKLDYLNEIVDKYHQPHQLFYNQTGLIFFINLFLGHIRDYQFLQRELPKLMQKLYSQYKYLYGYKLHLPLLESSFKMYQTKTNTQIKFKFQKNTEKPQTKVISLFEDLKIQNFQFFAQESVRKKNRSDLSQIHTIQYPNPNLQLTTFFRIDFNIREKEEVFWVGLTQTESQNIQCILRAICCIANRGGGLVLLGISTAGEITGVEMNQKKKQKLKKILIDEGKLEKRIFPKKIDIDEDLLPILNQKLNVLRLKIRQKAGGEMFFLVDQCSKTKNDTFTLIWNNNYRFKEVSVDKIYSFMHFSFYNSRKRSIKFRNVQQPVKAHEIPNRQQNFIEEKILQIDNPEQVIVEFKFGNFPYKYLKQKQILLINYSEDIEKCLQETYPNQYSLSSINSYLIINYEEQSFQRKLKENLNKKCQPINCSNCLVIKNQIQQSKYRELQANFSFYFKNKRYLPEEKGQNTILTFSNTDQAIFAAVFFLTQKLITVPIFH